MPQIMDENLLLTSAHFVSQKTYWADKLSGDIVNTVLLQGQRENSRAGNERKRIDIHINGFSGERLMKLSKGFDLSIYIILLAALKLLIYRYTGNNDICIFSPVYQANISEETINDRLVIRDFLHDEVTVKELLLNIRKSVLEAYENQDYPFARLMDSLFDLSSLSVEDGRYFPNVVCALENIHGASHLTVEALENKLVFSFCRKEEQISGYISFNSDIYESYFVKKLTLHFIRVLEGILIDAYTSLSRISFLSEEEKKQLLDDFNNTDMAYSLDDTIGIWFERQVEITPHRAAVVYKDQWLTYAQLDKQSNLLASQLRSKGVIPDSIVAILSERSLQMIVGVMAVIKSGGAYLPVDPQIPGERITYMLQDTHAPLILAQPHFRDKIDVAEVTGEVMELNDRQSCRSGSEPPGCKDINTPDHLVYVIYTSGSTGRPKGVMVQHNQFVNVARGWRQEYRLAEGETHLLQIAGFSFDVFAGDLARTLLNSGRLVICPDDSRMDPPALYELIRSHKINLFESIPNLVIPLMEYVAEQRLPVDNLKLVILGSDICPTSKFKKLKSIFSSDMRIINSYGVTETAIDSSYYEAPAENIPASPHVPIGKPLPNMKFYVLNDRQTLQPIGVRGGLYIGGSSVSRGYLNRPELTNERFIENPYSLGERIYKTGDGVRWLPDGNMDFLGRLDHQVKIRGYRIEPGEIENRLLEYPGIKEALVLVGEDFPAGSRKHEPGDKYLCAYMVADTALTLKELRDFLSKELPDYMVPTYFIPIDRLPLTANGQLDKKALPRIDDRLKASSEYVPSTNETEQRLEAIWCDVLNRDKIGIHDDFFEVGGQSLLAMKVVAMVSKEFNVKIPLVDIFRLRTIKEVAEKISELRVTAMETASQRQEALIRPFDLSESPLFRVNVIRLKEDSHLLFIDIHHIITDGVSMDLITNDLLRLYEHRELQALPFQYKNYSLWQSRFFQGKRYRQQEEYWLKCFQGEIPRLNLPLDFTRPVVKKGEGKTVYLNLGIQLTKKIERFLAKEAVTLYMFILAIYNILLTKYTGQEDIIVGVPVAGRTHAAVSEMVGMFINTLAIRNYPQKELSFSWFLRQVKNNFLSALENQDYQFDMLIDRLNLSGDASRNPLFDVMLASQNVYEKAGDISIDSLKIKPLYQGDNGALFDLILGFAEVNENLILGFNYDIHLFKEETVQRMVKDFNGLLSFVVSNPEEKIEKLITLDFPEGSEAEKAGQGAAGYYPVKKLSMDQHEHSRVLYRVEETEAPYLEDKLIHQPFEDRAAHTPDRIALISGDRQLTYQELNQSANKLAALLLKLGVRPYTCVGLMAERSPEMMVGMLAILKAGGAYLAIKPEYPEGRVRYMIADSNIRILLIQRHLHREVLDRFIDHVIQLDNPGNYSLSSHAPVPTSGENPLIIHTPRQLAYVLYTSGSTGRPNGVMVDHRGVVNRLIGTQNLFPLGAEDTILQRTPYDFDVSVIELFYWFIGGARICFLEPTAEKDMGRIYHTLVRNIITITTFTPSILHIFLSSLKASDLLKLTALKWVFVLGEQLPLEVSRQFNRLGLKGKMINLYGPTEAIIHTSYYPCNSLPEVERIPIGIPLSNTGMYILNQSREPVQVGEVGELYISGISLARGYLNSPELTVQRFLPDLFSKGERMYKTGDLAKMLPDGNIVFFGRKDHQVKIRGVRIELGEIEAALLKHADISEAVVIDRTNDAEFKFLAAYIVTKREFIPEKLRAYLLRQLPEVMIPSAFIKLDHMPLTSSGKIDRKRLRLSEMSNIIHGNDYMEPRNELERQLISFWSEFLDSNPQQVGIDDNFFKLGGDSLKANLLLTKINQEFNTAITIKQFFDAPTIKIFAPIIETAGEMESIPLEPMEKREYYPTSAVQKRLFLLNQLNSQDISYNVPWSIIFEGAFDKERLKGALEMMVERHEPLRTSFRVIDGEIMQQIHEECRLKLEFFNLAAPDPRMLDDIAANWLTVYDIFPYLEKEPVGGSSAPILPAEKKEYYSLSATQRRLYFLQQMGRESTAYNISAALELEGDFDKERLEATLVQLLKRHESMRTSFRIVDDQLVHEIRDHESISFPLEYYETSNKAGIKDIIHRFIRPFDLSVAPLIRVAMIKSGHKHHILVFDMHHIISDGTSIAIFLSEYIALYGGDTLPDLPLQYKDYSQWQHSAPQKEAVKKQETYWLKQFEGEIPVLKLPLDYIRPASQRFVGSEIKFEIGETETNALNQLARSEESTLYIILLSIFTILLSRLSGQEEIIVGTPIAGRCHHDLQNIIGMFVNTLALRNYPSARKTLREFLAEMRKNTLNTFENQEYPFDDLVEKLNIQRDASRNPLFDVMFVLQNMPFPNMEIEGLKLKKYEYKSRGSKFDITLTGEEHKNKLLFSMEYNVDLFKKETIKRFVCYFKTMVSRVIQTPDRKIYEIKFIPEKEMKRLLDDFNRTETIVPEGITIPQLFETQVEKTPQHSAVIFKDRILTYQELNKRSNRLSRQLRARGVKPDSVVGIMLDRSLEMVVGIIAILKAGSAYLPVSVDYPPARISHMQEDSGSKLLLTQMSELRIEAFAYAGETFAIDNEMLNNGESSNLEDVSEPEHLVYAIYTSGSTGTPKGTMVKLQGFMNLLYWYTTEFEMSHRDRNLLIAPLSFDLAQKNLFSSLITGGQLYLGSPGLYDYEELSDIVADRQITIINCAPSVFYPFVEINMDSRWIKLKSLVYLFLGGEPIHMEKLLPWVDSGSFRCRIVNTYGPTECTDIASAYRISSETLEKPTNIPIGKPIQNVKLYVLDKYRGLVPIGVTGELCISGIGLSRGYFNNPELTDEKFIPVPHLSEKRIYRTGDLVRRQPEGHIEFLGRIDQQVKIRGHRIEEGEIESRLLNHENIREAVVITRQDRKGDNYLCAYYSADGELPTSELRDYLSQELPTYMIPSYFIYLKRIPLTPHGKVHRKQLPEPAMVSPGGGHNDIGPRDELEEKLAAIWADALGIEQKCISITSNFFEIGGHSLIALMMIAKIHKEFNVRIPLPDIFKNPYIKGLAEHIKGAVKDRYRGITPAETLEYYPLSSAQKRLFILHQLEIGSTSYNMPTIMLLEGIIDKDKIESIFRKLIKRHESFRTLFSEIDGQPIQKILNEVDFVLEYIALVGEGTEDKLIQEFIRPFDLSSAPLLRGGLIRINDTKNLLMADMHHIISDGISVEIFFKEFSDLYGGIELPNLNIQYRDYSQWQNSEKTKESLKRQKEYWLNEFSGEIPVLNLPTDYSRPLLQSFEGSSLYFDIGKESTAALSQLALFEHVTVNILLLALYSTLLSKISGQEDIVVGAPVAGRGSIEIGQTVGMFVNTLVLRNFPTGHKSFRQLLQEVKDRSLAAIANQDYQFEDLVENVEISRDISRNPLFDTVFAYNNIEINPGSIPQVDVPGVKAAQRQYGRKTSKFDMTLIATEIDEILNFEIEYSTKLFKQTTIEGFADYFKRLLSVVLHSPGSTISQMEIISAAEKRQILLDFNDTGSSYPQEQTIHELFEEQVEKTPDHIAVVGQNGKLQMTNYQLPSHSHEPNTHRESISVTYRELNKKSNQLAHFLMQKGIQSNMMVGIMMAPYVEMIIGILGILKAGGAYLPIDPNYPQDRIEYMLVDSNVKVLLASSGAEVKVNEKSIEVIDIFNPPSSSTSASTCQVSSTNLAYIIYTSGTTGKPKGAMIEHRNVVRLMVNDQFQFDFNDRDVWTMFHSFCFDFSVWEMYGALLYGGKLIVISKMAARDTGRYLEILKEEGITVLNQTPSVFYHLMGLELKEAGKDLRIRFVIFGGEALSPGKLKEWKAKYPAGKLINMYGITETTVHVTFKEIQDREIRSNISNIGRPIPTLSTYVMDKHLKLQPVGIAGELCVGGDGVGRGYLNRPELTAERFIGIHDSSFTIHRLYRTGDLARWFPDGELEYLGRIDHQVKIRGYRIELGEIESRLAACDGIKDTVVISREDEKGDKYLCAYIVAENETDISIPDLREYLAARLPDYMIPSCFVKLEELPLTPNGKIDKKVLPEPGTAVTATAGGYIPPRNETDRQLIEIWSEVLGIDKEQIGIDANFFEIGGHSLKATELISKIYKRFNIKITLAEIFITSEIRGLSQYIKEAEKSAFVSIQPGEEKEYYAVSSAQKRMFILNRFKGEDISDIVIRVMEIEGRFNKKKLERAISGLVQRHETFRTSFELRGSAPVQRVHEELYFTIKYMEVEENQIETFIDQFTQPFDLGKAPLFRVALVKIAADKNRYILIYNIHHIISDAVSMVILPKDFIHLYYNEPLPELRMQYRDFAAWQNEQLQSEAIKKHEEYWLSLFSHEIPVLNMPFDYPRPQVQTFAGDSLEFQFDRELTREIKKIALNSGSTLYMVLLALYTILLSKYSGQEDIIVGTPIAGRPHADLENIIGFFVNTLAMRNYPKGKKRFSQFLEEVKSNSLKAYENQDYQFDELIKKLGLKPKPGRHMLFDTMFAVQNAEPNQHSENLFQRVGEFNLKPYPYRDKVTQFDIIIHAVETDVISFKLQYCTKLFKRETIERFVGYFEEVSRAATDNGDIQLKDITISHDLGMATSRILDEETDDFGF